MNIPDSVALELQFCVGVMATDCLNPLTYLNCFNGVLGCGDGYDRASWQITVDVMYRLIRCQLIHYPWVGEDGGEYDRLIQALSIFDDEWQTRSEWFDDLCPTDLCLDLVEKYDLTCGLGLDGYQLSAPFVAEIERMFESNGVPWSDMALVPLVLP